jgi:hypothetical protein
LKEIAVFLAENRATWFGQELDLKHIAHSLMFYNTFYM